MITIKPVFDFAILEKGVEQPCTRRWEYARGAALLLADSNIVFIYAASRGEFTKILNRILIELEIYKERKNQ